MSNVKDSHSPTEDTPETIVKKTDLTKGLEPPWSWVQQFAAVPQSEKSYNFVESDTTPADGTPHLLTDGSFDFCTGHFREDESDIDGSITSTTLTDATNEKFKIMTTFIDEVLGEIDLAINAGKCDIKDMKSICSVISEQRFDGKEDGIQVISDKLREIDESKSKFENLNELGNYLKEECGNELTQKTSIEPLSKKLMESDIQIDENVLTKKVPDDMILGLVESNSEPTEIVTPIEGNVNRMSPVSNASEERRENIRMVQGFITDAIDEIHDSDVEADENILPTFNCDMPALPGIGKACSSKIMDAFLVYILSKARDEKGMVYPRFLQEPNCPVMMNSLN